MKNRPIVTSTDIASEWEDDILFDADDPDFCNISPNMVNVLRSESATDATTATSTGLNGVNNTATITDIGLKVSTTMSLASVRGPQLADICSPLGRKSISVSSSLSDLVGSPLELSMDNVLTIEELRQQMGSCFACGVSWTDDHISLDCSECGGYSMERPCPLCDGQCGVQWKRDFTMSHACGKARWQGVCPSYPEMSMHLSSQNGGNAANATAAAATTTTHTSCAAAATQLRLAQELCARLEQLSAGGQT